MNHPDPLVELRGVSKFFPGVTALDDVSVAFSPGRVHALLGENGAGKSTLIKIVDGIYRHDRGELLGEGRALRLTSPRDAEHFGISVVHQQRTLAGNLSVAENLSLGRARHDWSVFHRSAGEALAARLLGEIGLDVDPRARVETLGPAAQQMVEVARAIGRDARVIIFDEPTTSLTPPEREMLFNKIRELRSRGIAVVYISHDLEDALALSDDVTVLRDGHVVAHLDGDVDVDTVINHMIGKSLEVGYPRRRRPQDDVALSVNDLQTRILSGVSLDVHRGEIVCLAGLVGAGRTEVLRAIYGLDPVTSGTIRIGGHAYVPAGPRTAISHRIGMVPEERKEQGLVLPLSISKNVTLGDEGSLKRLGLLSAAREDVVVRRSIAELQIKAPSARTLVGNLSGGNQQKVVLSRWLARNADLLLIDEPTIGIDVGARAEFYKLLDDYAAEGGACLVVSSDLTEVLGLADRIVVIRGGSSVTTLTGERMNRENALRAMTVGAA